MKKTVQKVLDKGAEQAELFIMEGKSMTVHFENGELKKVARCENRGGAIRLIRNGQIGFAPSDDLTAVGPWIDRALSSSQAGEKSGFEFASPGIYSEPDVNDFRIKELSEEEMIHTGRQALKQLKRYDPNIFSFCSIGKIEQTVSVVNSKGIEESYDKTLFHFRLGGETNFLKVRDGIDQSKWIFDLGSYLSSVIEPFRLGRRTAPVNPGPSLVVLTPRALSGLLSALETGLCGNRVHNGASPLKGKIQRQVLDRRITLYDDGLLSGSDACAPFDDEGVPRKKNVLFERGILKNYLLDLRSADELDMFPTGNGRRAGRFDALKTHLEPPRPGVNSWVLEGGERQFDEIFPDLDSGVMVDQIAGLKTSVQNNGDFSGAISLGYKIENGQITGRVENLVMTGNIYSLLSEKHLEEISHDQRWILGQFGGTHLLPTVFLKNVSLTSG